MNWIERQIILEDKESTEWTTKELMELVEAEIEPYNDLQWKIINEIEARLNNREFLFKNYIKPHLPQHEI